MVKQIINTYRFEELSSEVKAKLVEQYKNININSSWPDDIIEGFKKAQQLYGISVLKVEHITKMGPKDGALFTGVLYDLPKYLMKMGNALTWPFLYEHGKYITIDIGKISPFAPNDYSNMKLAWDFDEDLGGKIPVNPVFHEKFKELMKLAMPLIIQDITLRARKLNVDLQRHYLYITSGIHIKNTIKEKDLRFMLDGTPIPKFESPNELD